MIQLEQLEKLYYNVKKQKTRNRFSVFFVFQREWSVNLKKLDMSGLYVIDSMA